MKKLILLMLILFGLNGHAFGRDGFAIVIDPESYQQAKQEVDAYAKTVEQMHNLHVYIIKDRWNVPDSIREELKRLHYQKKDPIVGCVLIGDIPVAMIRDGQHMTSAFKMDQKSPRKESSVPSDRYYDDFGLRFKYLDKDNDAPYFYYSVTAESQQILRPDIYSGRIRPTDTGGVSRYQKLRDYLKKLVIEKQKNRQLHKMFYFSGHGYISDSRVARIDEKAAWFEHFPWLKNSTNAIGYMDHSDQYPVKERLMNELMRTDLDVAVLHHHGYWDTEYLNNIAPIATVAQAKEFIRKSCREHVYAAKQKGKDYEKMRKELLERFDLPETWLKDALNDSLAMKDSLSDAAEDLHIEDFAGYGYRPNTPVVMIDACFCGSFHLPDCIADEYIFQPGHTVVCIANSVNVLQDKWSDRLFGLIADGGCVGDVVRYSTYLESHVIGDPTFRFLPETGTTLDIDHIILENKAAEWKKLLKNKQPDIQSLAIEHLVRLGAIKSAELKKIYETSPYGIVRLQALVELAKFRDNNFIETVKLASQDSYEMLQRQAINFIKKSGDESLIPSLIKICISNNTSDRVNFDAITALGVMPKEKLIEEFKKQFDDPSVCYIHKDSVRTLILKTIEHNADYWAKDILALGDTATKPKTRIQTIRASRNNMVHFLIPEMIHYIETTATHDEKILAIEALGWHRESYMVPKIKEAMLGINKNTNYSEDVRNEALKTYNRLSEEVK